ncbi:hypothetical protein HMPREF9004_1291 [Schaalia cardiffensis F0333]|uniref:Uncharacterized protein n=1 Tax=Schaalia cardiffensis F0333 TaxID=888050 RepID=N6WCR7_9ACTO|nr:hypothetical protein HMPREF9004_1291 [Schaalia cardiffensis F0333]
MRKPEMAGIPPYLLRKNELFRRIGASGTEPSLVKSKNVVTCE